MNQQTVLEYMPAENSHIELNHLITIMEWSCIGKAIKCSLFLRANCFFIAILL